MRPVNVKSALIGTVTILIAAFLIIPVFIQDVQAEGMVIAPSKVVLNSNASPLKKSGNKAETDIETIKAIIHAPFSAEEVQDFLNDMIYGEDFVLDAEDFDRIYMQFSKFENGTEGIIVEIEAKAIRYCLDDDNLIVEFDRDDPDIYNFQKELNGIVHVRVIGDCSIISPISTEKKLLDIAIEETSDILFYDPMVRE